MARMVTRSMKAKGYCIRFPTGLPVKKINHKKLRAFMESDRVQIIYRNSPIHSRLDTIGTLIAYIYCFILYANLFRYIYTHPISENKQLAIA